MEEIQEQKRRISFPPSNKCVDSKYRRDSHLSETSQTSSIILKYRNKNSKISINNQCIVIEPLSTPNLRTVIPLSQVISVSPCYCRSVSKKLVCLCFENRPYDHGLRAVRVSYVVPVGKYQWKATFVPLFVPDDADNQADLTRVRLLRQVSAPGAVSSLHPASELYIRSSLSSSSSPSEDPPLSAQKQVVNWIESAAQFIQALARPRSFLVFVNPYSGNKRAPHVWTNKCAPLMLLAGIETRVIQTERANHAKDSIEDANFDISSYDGILCVGGDGMFSEILNAIIVRTQKQNSLNYNSPETRLMRPKMPIGVIPAGSTDAVAFGVTGLNDPTTSAIHAILGRVINIDISAVHEAEGSGSLIRYATSCLGYGFLADVLVESEKNRWMGPKRYDWAGLKRLMSLKAYHGELRLHISTMDGSPRDSHPCLSDCALCAKSAQRAKYLVEDADGSVLTIRGKFLSVNAATMACRCHKSKKGLSPAAHLGNGCSDVVVVSSPCSRLDYVRFLMRTGLNMSQSAFDLPFVDVYRVREFEYRPASKANGNTLNNNQSNNNNENNENVNSNNQITTTTTKVNENSKNTENGVWNCDGEILTTSAIRVKNHCQLLSVFGAGLENRIEMPPLLEESPARKFIIPSDNL